jgi:hypothetical protein
MVYADLEGISFNSVVAILTSFGFLGTFCFRGDGCWLIDWETFDGAVWRYQVNITNIWRKYVLLTHMK